MHTWSLKKILRDVWTEVTEATVGTAFAIQWRGVGTCIMRVGAEQEKFYREGYELQRGDVLRIKPKDKLYAFANTDGALTIEEVA